MVTKNTQLKTIKIYSNTHKLLSDRGSKGETFDSIINKLLREVKK